MGPIVPISRGRPFPPALVEFRAGKMYMKSDSNWVVTDERKGLVQIVKGHDQLMHLMWHDRRTRVTEDDLIIFPGI